jgi:peptidyl-tRNA hydrolase, PTH1 family
VVFAANKPLNSAASNAISSPDLCRGFFLNVIEKRPLLSIMKFLVVGLGNPGSEYAQTRHNVGFMAMDHMAGLAGLGWRDERLGQRCSIKHAGRTFELLKPNTYMNLSGKAAQYWLGQERLTPSAMLVITDDLALPFGTLRLRAKGSPGGHNGLKHIDEVLGHQVYARLRVGIGSEFSKGKQVDYVLGKFSENEQAGLALVLEAIEEAVKLWGLLGIDRAMTTVNAMRPLGD